MAMENMPIMKEIVTKVNGKMTQSMVRVYSFGRMATGIKENIKKIS